MMSWVTAQKSRSLEHTNKTSAPLGRQSPPPPPPFPPPLAFRGLAEVTLLMCPKVEQDL